MSYLTQMYYLGLGPIPVKVIRPKCIYYLELGLIGATLWQIITHFIISLFFHIFLIVCFCDQHLNEIL